MAVNRHFTVFLALIKEHELSLINLHYITGLRKETLYHYITGKERPAMRVVKEINLKIKIKFQKGGIVL